MGGVKRNRVVKEDQMEQLDQQLKNIERRDAIFNPGVVYQSLSFSPFSEEIFETELSSRFALPKFELYDGTTNSTKHVLHYKQLMETTTMSNSKKDAILNKVFASSLSGSLLV